MTHSVTERYRPPQLPLDVLYEDDTCVVVNKPSGLLSVPGRGEEKQDCMATRLLGRFPDAMIVHRLDMETSGILVFARGVDAQRTLSMAFASRQVSKAYEALVSGLPDPTDGSIDMPLITDWPNRPRQMVDHQRGKPSLTHFSTLARPSPDTSRLRLIPITGRSHQLRVHLQAIGHAILGDALYADAPARQQAPRLMLHACELRFPHPVSGEPIHISCPCPF
ncbi:RluA family pseudouridine synthase [Viridibacterium curvum]|uniref:Pseudouridine synthase n=1 Tax=Viridibacterium curvum TaxID=1101404 RepID=A0ABP9QB26_9RHOO